MTRRTAEAILDWIDEDDIPSEYGAEFEYYRLHGEGVMPRQGRITRIDELLSVRGVTQEQLFGSGNTMQGGDRDRDDLPWCRYLTLHGAVSNLRPSGEPKIYLNDNDLGRLYDSLEHTFGPEAATFIVGMRLAGTTEVRIPNPPPKDIERKSESGLQFARQRATLQTGEFPSSSQAAGERATDSVRRHRSGLDLRRKATYRIRSILDLVETRVRIDIDHKEEVLNSPWKLNLDNSAQVLRAIDAEVTSSSESQSLERINVTTASLPVLMTIPGMPESLARRMVISVTNDDEFVAMLRSLSSEEMNMIRSIYPYITLRGDIYKGQSVVDYGTKTAQAIEFILDSSQKPAILLDRSER